MQKSNDEALQQKFDHEKYLCHVLTIRDTCQMIEFVRWFIFIKIVSQVVKRLKKIVMKKILIKKTEQGCDN